MVSDLAETGPQVSISHSAGLQTHAERAGNIEKNSLRNQLIAETLLLQILCKHGFKFLFRGIPHPFLKHIAFPIEQVDLGLIAETQGPLEIKGVRIVGIQVSKLDPAKIFRFKPMDHGRHRSAGTSGEAEEFHEMQSA
jgi:hypothetical protein